MSNIIEYNIPKETFIGGYIMPDNVIDDMLNYFETNKKRANPGTSYNTIKGARVNNDVKQSLDYSIPANADHWPIFEYRTYLQECLNMYTKKYSMVNSLSHFNIIEDYNIQYYPVGGGFKVWHSERSSLDKANRILVFMTYLNDVEDGGTDFMYQNFQSPAKKGLTLIWPTDWTHTHKGIISNTKEKYIVTGWYSFIDNTNE